ncbi:MAG: uracil-DNA glycosylase, partial [Pseudomonadota bacterium]|nr:uracil-DNA glycosylase [Pseudomonadota bacterium]
MAGPYAQAVAEFRAIPAADGWRRLPFFAEGAADAVAARVDARIAAGAHVLPPPSDIFTGLRL